MKTIERHSWIIKRVRWCVVLYSPISPYFMTIVSIIAAVTIRCWDYRSASSDTAVLLFSSFHKLMWCVIWSRLLPRLSCFLSFKRKVCHTLLMKSHLKSQTMFTATNSDSTTVASSPLITKITWSRAISMHIATDYNLWLTSSLTTESMHHIISFTDEILYELNIIFHSSASHVHYSTTLLASQLDSNRTVCPFFPAMHIGQCGTWVSSTDDTDERYCKSWWSYK